MQLHPQYYYQQLPPPERAAYHGMLTCLRELTPSARIPRLPMETLSTLFFQLRLDHPEIFYAVGFSCRAVPEAAFVEFWPEYRFEKKRIRELRKEQEQQDIEALKLRLKEAVMLENFEAAAKYRDEIKALQAKEEHNA